MRFIVLICSAALIAACTNDVQTSSGRDYLSRYETVGSPNSGTSVSHFSDEAIRKAANVEPIIKFPATFGLARIVNGSLSHIPSEEAALWAELAEKKSALGRFVAINPLIAEFTAAATRGAGKYKRNIQGPGEIVQTIRLGAARQHVDAVLIYEVGARARNSTTALGFADLTIIGGFFLPTRSIDAQGIAQALLLDVRNGYPYGTANAESDLSELWTSWGAYDRQEELQNKAARKVVENLMPEVDEMLDKLVLQMASRKQTAEK